MKPPSSIAIHANALVDTFGHRRAEVAALWLVRVCQVDGDHWQPVRLPRIAEVARADIANREPIASLATNPFLNPDFQQLVGDGFVVHVGSGPESTFAFSERGFDRLFHCRVRLIVSGESIMRRCARREHEDAEHVPVPPQWPCRRFSDSCGYAAGHEGPCASVVAFHVRPSREENHAQPRR